MKGCIHGGGNCMISLICLAVYFEISCLAVVDSQQRYKKSDFQYLMKTFYI